MAFITSSITSLRLTNPLKEIAETARKFGHGEYEVRVQGYEKRKDEVGELAEAIGATQSAVSHQLRQLKQAHLVKFQRDGKSVIYSLSDDHVYTMLAQGMTHICE